MSTAVLIPLFNSIASIIVAVIVALVGMAINKYVKDTNARNTLTTALSNASGVALSYGQANGDQFLQDHSVKSAALNAAMNYIADQAAGAKAHFGLTDADIATKITAHVAKSLSLATPIPPVAAPVVVVEAPSEPPAPIAPVAPKPTVAPPLAPATPVVPPVAPIKS
jgi:hypothetical protein